MKSLPTSTLFITIVVALGGFVFGFDASVIAGTVKFITQAFDLTPWQQGMVVSSPTLGALIAMFFAGAVSDHYGRKQTLLFVSLLYVVSAIFSALATSFEMLLTARFVGGLAFCSLMIAPMYIAEVSSAQHRGKLVSVNQFNIVLGLSASYFTNYGLLTLSQSDAPWVAQLMIDSDVWRWMLALEIIPALIWFILLFGIPESPRWLSTKGRYDEAKVNLARLQYADVESELDSIKATLSTTTLSLQKRIQGLWSSRLRWPIVIGLVIGIVQQLTGINVIFFYAPTIFEQSGVGTDASFVQAIGVGVINVLFTIVAMFAIDRFGRRPLLLIGLSGILVSMLLCAYGFYQAEYYLDVVALHTISQETSLSAAQLTPILDMVYHSDVEFKSALINLLGNSDYQAYQGVLLQQGTHLNATLILVAILSFVAFFAMSLGPVMWVLFAEIFPTEYRGVAISFVTVFNSLCSFLMQFLFPWELATFGAGFTFLTYAIFAFIGLAFVVKYLPETKGKSLEQIQADFSVR
ncbi:MAG: sugar porter family MFS transporter [Glaciecola sp.]|nr:sugar porter family MFS transporter [Glaciecola sp.]MDG1816087.1 sugar porter family MFS transporter [Glaciecola sp.]